MQTLRVRNVHSALPVGLDLVKTRGIVSDSRNGGVIVVDGPVSTQYDNPRERVIFHPERDAHPFFHFFESLWMLAGRNDLQYVTHFVRSMANYSDDGVTLHGAYGYRWRQHFGQDQLLWAIKRLRENPDDRRVVIGMWDPAIDIPQAEASGKDVPCNISLHLQINRQGALDMTVFNRSNDVIWGAYGANAVHFSMLQEFVAASLEREVGRYWQVSDNFHVYVNTFSQVEDLADCRLGKGGDNPYETEEVAPFDIMSPAVSTEQWLQDLNIFMDEGPIVGMRDKFFRRVATPMIHAFTAFRRQDDSGRFDKAREILQQCCASDWRKACTEWIDRREERANAR